MSDSFDVKVYDPTQIRATFAGVNISRGAGASGYADGEFCSIKQTADAFIEVVGTDGTVVWSKTNARSNEVMFRLLQTSVTNTFFSAMLAADEAAPNGAGIGILVVQDLQGTTVFRANRARIWKPADQSFDKSAKEREWLIRAVRNSIVIGNN